ncbi:MAG: hypothetical protein LWX00_02470 [Spirochaetia bacterium]|nr:hypothetical protein [Spirochaetia bacterium]
MKRKAISMAASAILLVLVLASCSNFTLDSLFGNVYKQQGLGQLNPGDIQDAPAEDLIDQSGILAGQLSQQFFELVKDNPDIQQEVITKLEEIINDPNAQAALAQAAIAVAIEINLNEVGANQVMENAPAAFAMLLEDGFDITKPADLQRLIDALFPPSLLNKSIFTPDQLAVITDIVDRLQSISDYIDALVARIDENGGVIADGLDAGTLAQIGLIVRAMNMLEPLYPAENPTLGASVAEVLNHLEDPDFDPSIYIDYSAFNVDSILNDPATQTLADAAGIDLQALINQFGGGN